MRRTIPHERRIPPRNHRRSKPRASPSPESEHPAPATRPRRSDSAPLTAARRPTHHDSAPPDGTHTPQRETSRRKRYGKRYGNSRHRATPRRYRTLPPITGSLPAPLSLSSCFQCWQPSFCINFAQIELALTAFPNFPSTCPKLSSSLRLHNPSFPRPRPCGRPAAATALPPPATAIFLPPPSYLPVQPSTSNAQNPRSFGHFFLFSESFGHPTPKMPNSRTP